MDLRLPRTKPFGFDGVLFSLLFCLVIFSISPFLVQAFFCKTYIGHMLSPPAPAQTIISSYCGIPFSLKAIKNENPHFRRVPIKYAPFVG